MSNIPMVTATVLRLMDQPEERIKWLELQNMVPCPVAQFLTINHPEINTELKPMLEKAVWNEDGTLKGLVEDDMELGDAGSWVVSYDKDGITVELPQHYNTKAIVRHLIDGTLMSQTNIDSHGNEIVNLDHTLDGKGRVKSAMIQSMTHKLDPVSAGSDATVTFIKQGKAFFNNFKYDDKNRKIEGADTNGTTRFEYGNDLPFATTIHYPCGEGNYLTSHTEYDAKGNVVKVTTYSGEVFVMENAYCPAGNLLTISVEKQIIADFIGFWDWKAEETVAA